MESIDINNVVLKVGLKNGISHNVQTFRDVRCTTLHPYDPHGSYNIDIFRKTAVVMFENDNVDINDVNLSIYNVILTYIDRHNDHIILSSDKDLITSVHLDGNIKIIADVSSRAPLKKKETKSIAIA